MGQIKKAYRARPEVVERRERTWELARQGWSTYKIADELGISQHTAWGYVTETLQKLRGQTLELAEDWRNQELARIDALYDKLVPDFADERSIEQVCADVCKGKPGEFKVEVLLRAVWSTYGRKYKAIEAAIKLIERRCKLLGLDAPTRQVIEIGSATESIARFLVGWCERHQIADEARREIADGLRLAVGIQTRGALPGSAIQAEIVMEEADSDTDSSIHGDV